MVDVVDVVRVRVLDDYQLLLQFEDGATGVFDMTPFLDKGVFSRLRDPDVFCSASIEGGTVSWPGGIDIAPERLYTDMVRE